MCEHARKGKREIGKENATSFLLNEVDSERYFLCINIAREFQDGNDTWREDTRSVVELSVIDQCARSRMCEYSLVFALSSLM